MAQPVSHWTASSLVEALQASPEISSEEMEFVAAPETKDVFEVHMKSAGDVVLFVVVSAAQITTTTILWGRDELDDPQAFEALMLRSHRTLMPLSALSIGKIGDREYHELFGTMSSTSPIAEIVEEFKVIAENAIELARELGPKAIA
ncbi:hypothetical protein SAMN04488518_10470 [Pseudovibrio ascidiaceicola]|uniref:DUF2170 domain-containing protein n=1 Tax=Pseudovibrio ascidiaceicola TaxID=285279 RepID=A0A1I3YJN8_9HYPH|nr:DUF2170 family protein [Pseudovibrio ascidiaceicola]SFK32035.1 hypothetical protein SAMN04488518_10470 [Pseudovibrio ascidiaceicola]